MISSMYGLVGRIQSVPGRVDELAAILLRGATGLPGCLSYVVAKDMNDPDSIWVTEVWDSQESHAAPLSLGSVREAIAEGRSLIAGFFDRTETLPVGGHGID